MDTMPISATARYRCPFNLLCSLEEIHMAVQEAYRSECWRTSTNKCMQITTCILMRLGGPSVVEIVSKHYECDQRLAAKLCCDVHGGSKGGKGGGKSGNKTTSRSPSQQRGSPAVTRSQNRGAKGRTLESQSQHEEVVNLIPQPRQEGGQVTPEQRERPAPQERQDQSPDLRSPETVNKDQLLLKLMAFLTQEDMSTLTSLHENVARRHSEQQNQADMPDSNIIFP